MWADIWAGIVEFAIGLIEKLFGRPSVSSGEKLGKAETERDAAVKEVNEDAQASQARSDAITADAGDGVREFHPGDRPG